MTGYGGVVSFEIDGDLWRWVPAWKAAAWQATACSTGALECRDLQYELSPLVCWTQTKRALIPYTPAGLPSSLTL